MPEAEEEKVEEEFVSAKDGLEESEVVPKEVSNKAESVEDDKKALNNYDSREGSDENSDNEAEPMEPEVEQVLEAKSEE